MVAAGGIRIDDLYLFRENSTGYYRFHVYSPGVPERIVFLDLALEFYSV
jgi:hypothetical protein